MTDRGRRAMEMWTRRRRAEAALREAEENQEEIIQEFQSSLQIAEGSQSMPEAEASGESRDVKRVSPRTTRRCLVIRTKANLGSGNSEASESMGTCAVQRSSQDRWNRSLWDQGWIIREHHKLRKRRFHPVHRGAPMKASTIEAQRVTSMVSPQKQLVRDE